MRHEQTIRRTGTKGGLTPEPVRKNPCTGAAEMLIQDWLKVRDGYRFGDQGESLGTAARRAGTRVMKLVAKGMEAEARERKN